MSRTWHGLVMVALLALLAACAPAGQAGLMVTDAWALPSTLADHAGAAYLTISNGTGEADRLLSVTTPAATTVEMHESTTMDGMMGMSPVAAIEVPAGGQAELKPGGFHLMLIGLTQALKAGDTLDLTLTFEKAGPITVTAAVRDQ